MKWLAFSVMAGTGLRGNQLAAALFIVSFLGGCGGPSYHVVLYDEQGTIFEGTATAGGGPMSLSGIGIICSGESAQTVATSRTVGSQGSWWVSCSDGRVVRGEWVQTDTLGGAGSGIDEKGNSYIAKFHVESIRLSGARRRASDAPAKARNPEQTAVASPSKAQETLSGSGTGFVVNNSGHILTAYHVIEDCKALRRRRGEAVEELTLIAKDSRNDLAVLKQTTGHTAPASFRGASSVRPGESVVVVGFPYYRALSSQAIVTTGTISSVSSLGDDTRFLQITAPVQSGNSGGPLLDQSGNVVGVVLSKLDALKVAELTGDIPQNVNFAIKSSVAETFLQSHGIQYLAKPSSTTIEPADIWEQARDFIVIVECWR